jgi:hypothetical protein
MNTQILIPILAAVAVLIAIGLIVWLILLNTRSWRLKKKFGPEYSYTLEKMGDRRSAESSLQEREKRVVKLDIHPLNEHEKERYHTEWTGIQASFVDDPAQSVEKANRLITEVMIARGFPVSDFEQRAADLSVLYPNFAPLYRQANSIATRNKDSDSVSTEELRKAMVNYHSLFDQLLGTVHPTEPEKEPLQEKQREAA